MNLFTAPLAYIGQTEILIIAGVALLLFGGTKLPQLARGLGEGIREFKSSMNPDEKSGANKTDDEEK